MIIGIKKFKLLVSNAENVLNKTLQVLRIIFDFKRSICSFAYKFQSEWLITFLSNVLLKSYILLFADHTKLFLFSQLF